MPMTLLRANESKEWVLLALILAMLGGFVGWGLATERTQILQRERERLGNQAKVIDENLSRQLIAVDNALRSLQGDLPDMLSERNGIAHLNRLLGSLSGAMPGVRTLLILDKGGTVLASNKSALIGMQFDERSYFVVTKKSNDPVALHVSPPFESVLSSFVMFISKSTQNDRGDFANAIVASLDPDYFATLLGSVRYASDMWAQLVHADGTQFVIVPNQSLPIGFPADQPGSPFRQHREKGWVESILIGPPAPGVDPRLTAERTIRPAALHVDNALIVALSRSMTEIMLPWRDKLLQHCAAFVLFAALTIASLAFFQSRQRELARVKILRDQEGLRARTILKAASDGIVILDQDGRLHDANDAFLRMIGRDASAIGRIGVQDWDTHSSLAEIQAMIRKTIAEKAVRVFETQHRRSDGSVFDAEISVSGIEIDGQGFLYASSRDISERKKAEAAVRSLTEELREMARTDPLTGLANRRAFADGADAAFKRSRRFKSDAAVLMIDIDHFKQVNDNFGHEAGDNALRALASTLLDLARTTDLVARFGGEEFVLLLPETDLAGARGLAERIRDRIAKISLESPKGPFGITVSIGLASFDPDDQDWFGAVRRADQAMYRAKTSGRNQVVEE